MQPPVSEGLKLGAIFDFIGVEPLIINAIFIDVTKSRGI